MESSSGSDAEKSQDVSQGQEAGQSPQEAAAATQVGALQQALDHLIQTEQRLLAQWYDLQRQIDGYTKEAQQAWQEQRQADAEEAINKRSQLMPTLAAIQEQGGRIQARKEEIARQRQDLLSGRSSPPRTGSPAGLSSAPPLSPLSTKRKRSRTRWILAAVSVLVVVLVLAGAGVGYRLIARAPTPTAVVTVSPSPTQAPTATPFPKPVPQAHPFQPDGSAPTNQDCLRYLGYPCYSPEQVQQAFGLNELYKPGFDGTGQTIVILGAGQAGTVKSSLTRFDQAWGLPDPPSFEILQPNGPPTTYICPGGEDALAIENTLDVEWAHAIAPGANIVLVLWYNSYSRSSPPDENCGLYDIDGGVSYIAANHLGTIISISYGGSELGDVHETASQVVDDQGYERRAHEAFEDATTLGITILASSGDAGVTNPNDYTNRESVWPTPNVGWPADDPSVLAVGGTLLDIQDESGTYGGERVWQEEFGAGGGGLSAVFSEPDYQKMLPHQEMFAGKRAIPDVSFPANYFSFYTPFQPNYLGNRNSQWNNWGVIGGTSLSAPCWAGLIAILNQMRGEPAGDLHAALYSLHGKGFHDITSGDNSFGGVQGYSAVSGYDLSTGWGTPIAFRLLPALIAALDGTVSDQCPGQSVCA